MFVNLNFPIFLVFSFSAFHIEVTSTEGGSCFPSTTWFRCRAMPFFVLKIFLPLSTCLTSPRDLDQPNTPSVFLGCLGVKKNPTAGEKKSLARRSGEGSEEYSGEYFLFQRMTLPLQLGFFSFFVGKKHPNTEVGFQNSGECHRLLAKRHDDLYTERITLSTIMVQWNMVAIFE